MRDMNALAFVPVIIGNTIDILLGFLYPMKVDE